MTTFWGTMSEAVSDAQFLTGCGERAALSLVRYDAYLRRWYVWHEPVDYVPWRADAEDYAARLEAELDLVSPAFWEHVRRMS